MRLWITRPSAVEVFMGGLRGTMAWLSMPAFSHRPTIPDFNLYQPDGGQLFASVYREEGWVSEVGGVPASPFLKQDEAVKAAVGEFMIRSCLIEGWDFVDWNMTNVDRILSPGYENDCAVHWKRFLLEIDLKTHGVVLVEPRAIVPEGFESMLGGDSFHLLRDHSQYLDGDLRRPYIADDYREMNLSSEDAWI